jgi:spermidine/putrescine transport system permease protein
MRPQSVERLVMWGYLGVFFAYLFLPLALMSVIAFNDSRLPTLLPWRGFTWRWFAEIGDDALLIRATWNSLAIGGLVVLLSVPLGLGAAILLGHLRGRLRASVYAILVSPILTPGVIIGISSLIFWQQRFDVSGGIFVTVLAQSSFAASYAMLFIGARLQRFDFTQVEAALDLGASHLQAFRTVTLPFLMPAIAGAVVVCFLQSLESYNTTLFTIGADTTFTLHIASKVRLGLTPAVNALTVIVILITVAGVAAAELARRRAARTTQPRGP